MKQSKNGKYCEKKSQNGKCPKLCEEKITPCSAKISGNEKIEGFFKEDSIKSNEKLMEDIRKALISSYSKMSDLKDVKKSNESKKI